MVHDAIIITSVRIRLTIFKDRITNRVCYQCYATWNVITNQQNLGSRLVFHLSNNNHCHLVLRHPGVIQSKSKHLHKH